LSTTGVPPADVDERTNERQDSDSGDDQHHELRQRRVIRRRINVKLTSSVNIIIVIIKDT